MSTSNYVIEADDLVEVCDITSPFYGHNGKVVRRIVGWECPRYFIVAMSDIIPLTNSRTELTPLHLTFNNHQLDVLTKHDANS
jgi:hypothetical protein